MNRIGIMVAAGAAAAVAALASPVPASAATPLTISADVNGRPVAGSSDHRPVPLRAGHTRVGVRMANRGSTPVTVDAVRFEGRVMGLTFFASEVTVRMTVAPGTTESRDVVLSTTYVQHQAVGLIPGSISALDADGHELAAQPLVLDVRGSLRSIYGVFGIVVAVLALASFAANLLALARHRLSDNRWSRGVRFLVPGAGAGLVLVFTLSVLRVWSPQPSRLVPLVAACALALFAAGYLSPSPGVVAVVPPVAPAAGSLPAVPR